jgi:hypothetical protein
MNDKYLWEKKGSDPDIETLERKLAVFRHRETPLRIPSVERSAHIVRVPRWRISLAFAFAAAVIAAVLVAALVVRIAKNKDVETVFVASPEVEIVPAPPAAVEEEKSEPAPVSAPKIIPQFAHAKRSTIRTRPITIQRPKSKDPKPTSVAALTEEEKYAYRQLMLALTISGSKLKIVKDTINGNENIANTSGNDKR